MRRVLSDWNWLWKSYSKSGAALRKTKNTPPVLILQEALLDIEFHLVADHVATAERGAEVIVAVALGLVERIGNGAGPRNSAGQQREDHKIEDASHALTISCGVPAWIEDGGTSGPVYRLGLFPVSDGLSSGTRTYRAVTEGSRSTRKFTERARAQTRWARS